MSARTPGYSTFYGPEGPDYHPDRDIDVEAEIHDSSDAIPDEFSEVMDHTSPALNVFTASLRNLMDHTSPAPKALGAVMSVTCKFSKRKMFIPGKVSALAIRRTMLPFYNGML